MAITWSKAYSTGVQEVDEQHKTLFDQINKLNLAMQSGQGQESLGETLAFVEDYVRKHFRDEERLMERVDCPVAEQNKKAHAEFLAKFTELRKRYETEGAKSSIVLAINSYLGTWLVKHIASIDTQLKDCVVPA